MRRLPNPRPIPLDRDQILNVAKILGRQANSTITREGRLHDGGWVLGSATVQIADVSGKEHQVGVWLITRPTRGWFDGVTGGFERSLDRILIQLPVDETGGFESLKQDTGWRDWGEFTLMSTLLHEFTHARDVYSSKVSTQQRAMHERHDFKAYVNQPIEVRARMQELADLAVRSIPEIKRTYSKPNRPPIPAVQWVLEQTELWRDIEKDLSDLSRKKILLGVERALRDAGMETEGKGALPNPADMYLYHVTDRDNLRSIAENGLQPGSGQSSFVEGMPDLEEYSKDKLFFSTRGGASHWVDQASGAGRDPVILRVVSWDLTGRELDYQGTQDSGSRCTFVTHEVPADKVEFLADEESDDWLPMKSVLRHRKRKSGKGATRNPRLVPIGDRKVLEDAAERLTDRLLTWAKATSHKTGAPGYMLQDEIQLPTAGQKGTRGVQVRISGEPTVTGRNKFVLGGSYVRNHIHMEVMADRLRGSFGTGKEDAYARMKLRNEILALLSHEMTHGAEPRLKEAYALKEGEEGFYKAWANDPDEIRANARMIWEQVRGDLDWHVPLYQSDRRTGATKLSMAEYVAEQSPEYQHLGKVLGEKGKKKVLQIIERELREAGVNTQGSGALANPSSVAPGMIDVEIDRDKTNTVRARYKMGGVFGTFLTKFPLYRALDGEEAVRIVRTGKITGGLFSVLAERMHGASWGADLDEVVQWANGWRGKRLGKDIFVAMLPDSFAWRFYHFSDKIPFSPLGSEEQRVELPKSICSVGLGCSLPDVGPVDVRWFRLDLDGSLEEIKYQDLEAYAQSKPVKEVDVRFLENGRIGYGSIMGEDVIIVSTGEKPIRWDVKLRDDTLIVKNAKSHGQAIKATKHWLSLENRYAPVVDAQKKGSIPNPTKNPTTFPKVCQCGRSYDEAGWEALPLARSAAGPQGRVKYEWGEEQELRNCPCGSTLVRVLSDGEPDPDENPSRRPVDLSALELVEVTEGGVTFKTGQPVKIRYLHNTEKSGYYGKQFQQDIEPAGFYVNHIYYDVKDPPRGWEQGEVDLRSPLVLRFTTDVGIGTLYGPGSWKARLHSVFKAKGCVLTRKLRKAGYDSIVTVMNRDPYPSNTAEIVLLPEDCKSRRKR